MLKRLIGWWRTGNGSSGEVRGMMVHIPGDKFEVITSGGGGGSGGSGEPGGGSEGFPGGVKMEITPATKSDSEVDRSKPLPCPFCGKKPTVRHYSHGQTAVDCTTDGCSRGIYATEELALRAWNMRGGVKL